MKLELIFAVTNQPASIMSQRNDLMACNASQGNGTIDERDRDADWTGEMLLICERSGAEDDSHAAEFAMLSQYCWPHPQNARFSAIK